MANHSVGARDELHESGAIQSLMFCFYNTSQENSCFVVDLVYFISVWLRVAVSLNATVCLVSFGKIVETKERSSHLLRN